MKTNIIEEKINLDELNEEVHRIEHEEKKAAYLFMNEQTFSKLCGELPFKEDHRSVMDRFHGRIGYLQGNDVYINNSMKYGEVEVR